MELHELTLLWQQGRFEELESAVTGVGQDLPLFAAAQYTVLRASVEKLDFPRAGQVIADFERSKACRGDWKIVYDCWKIFLPILSEQQEDINGVIGVFEQRISESAAGTFVFAVLNDLLANIIKYGIAMGQLSALRKNDGIRYAEWAINAYGQAGFPVERLNKIRGLIQTVRTKPFPSPDKAVEIAYTLLNEVAVQPLQSGYIQLSLAEMAFEKAHTAVVTEEVLQGLIARFDEAENSLKIGGHIDPVMLIYNHIGQLLLRYGYDQGISFLEQAVERYQKIGWLANAHSCLLSIADWYLHHGDEANYQPARSSAEELGLRLHLKLPLFIKAIGEIDSAYRRGEIGKGRELYAEAYEEFSGNHLRNQLDILQANNLLKINRTEEALVIYLDMAKRYEPLQLSSWLADAYYHLATQYNVRRPQLAKEILLLAIRIDDELEDLQASVPRIQLMVDALVQEQRQTTGKVEITAEIDYWLNEGFRRLRGENTVTAFKLTGAMLQTKGQAYFYCGRYDEAKKYYNGAKALFTGAKLVSSLAFLYSQESLLFLQTARSLGSIKLYDESISLLRQSSQYFEEMGYILETARYHFLTGVSYYESARLEGAENKRADRYLSAEHHFEDAYQTLSKQIQLIDRSEGVSRQESMIAFVKDGVKIFEQGFQMNWVWTKDYWAALKWLDRLKSQALLESIAARNHVAQTGAIPVGAMQMGQSDGDLQDFEDMVRQRLKAHELVITYYVSAESVVVFGMRSDWNKPQAAVVQVHSEAVRKVQDRFFSNKFDGLLGMVRTGTEQRWQSLNGLIKPVLDWSDEGDIIRIIPHDILHDLPLHALWFEDKKYLIERNPVCYHFSLSMIAAEGVRANDPVNFNPVEIFGDSRENLSFARREAEEIGGLFHVQPHLGKLVTLGRVKEAIARAGLLHLSGHGMLSDQGGLENGMLMADGEVLKAADLFVLATNASLVVLSGCETGVSQRFAGDELMGLIRGFLYAGARRLIVSQWKVNDESTSEFFRKFYQYLGRPTNKMTTVAALRQTMIDMKRSGAHFYYWGAFKLIGNYS
jgi:CHAT domain-containing protein/tetratricopeptide (TPR) repeat protein